MYFLLPNISRITIFSIFQYATLKIFLAPNIQAFFNTQHWKYFQHEIFKHHNIQHFSTPNIENIFSTKYSSIFSTSNIENIFSTKYSSIFQHPNIENIFSTQIFKHFSTPNIENIFSTPSCGGASPVCPDGSALSTTGRRPCTGGRWNMTKMQLYHRRSPIPVLFIIKILKERPH